MATFLDEMVGDGGRSWIQKAYDRAKQQAIDDGVPLEEIVAKRWGVSCSNCYFFDVLETSEEAPITVDDLLNDGTYHQLTRYNESFNTLVCVVQTI